MAAPLRACASPGTAYRQDGHTFVPTKLAKTACGTVVRVTSLKFGDVRRMQDVVIMRVKRIEFAVPVQRVRLRGRG